ncbi:MAG TPA: CHAT domain-containing protein [Pyrinomonadaceae bacterium]|nr:CHAT domain-containing protein [Pyrinomonadaceae bacterium]
MKLSGALLVFLVVVHLLEANAPRPPADLGAVVLQAGFATPEKPATVAGRKGLLRELQEAVQIALGNGQNLDAARNLNRIGGLHMLLNDPQAALASHLQALDLLRQSPDAEVEVDSLNGSAAAYLSLEKQDTLAQTALDKALSLSRQVNYPLGEAQTLLTLSDLQSRMNQTTALVTAQAALTLWQGLDDKEGSARAYAQLGRCYMAQNILTSAAENLSKALELWRGLTNKAEEAEALILLGFVEFRKGEWQSSIDYYGQAYALLDEDAEPLKMGQIASGLGAAFLENGLPELGFDQYQRAVNYYQRAQDSMAESYATWGLARACYLKGDLTQASIYIQKSLDQVDKESLKAALPLEYLGRVHIDRGEYKAGLQDLESALKIYMKAENPKEMYRVQGLIGHAYDRQGLVGRAKSSYLEALDGFTRLQDRVNQAAVYYALGQLELKQKNYDLASDYLKQSIDVTENVRRVSTSQDLMTAFSATVQDRYEAYIECLMKQHEKQPARGFAVRAFETSELARARTLSELLLTVQAPGVDPQLAARQRSLRQRLRIKENDKINILAKKDSQDQVKALEAETAQLEGEYNAVNDEIRSRYPSYDELSKPTAWDLRHIQETILRDDDAVLLEYSAGTENSYAWVVSRDGFKSYALPAQKVINEAVQRVYSLSSTPPGASVETELDQATAALSKLVLEPVASSLNKPRIIVVADGSLNYIPFQLLRASAPANEPLISKYEVINVPSASILGQLRQEKQQRRPRSKILAAFGDPVFSSNYAQYKNSNSGELLAVATTDVSEPWRHAWRSVEINADTFDPSVIQPLAYSKLELKNLSDIAGPESFVARGFDASRQILETTDLSKYAILHFATHGLLDPKNPEFSGFFLSMVDATGRPQKGFITMQDVYRLQAPVDLVVLSACRTGLGKDVRGEGLIGLTRGFMYAGASSVVASLWKVDDEATANLMKHFYENMLQKGMRPAEALRAAQNTLRQDPHWQSPHFWAGFTLQGEFNQPIGVPANSVASLIIQKSIAAVLLLMLLTGIAWSFWRRRDRT